MSLSQVSWLPHWVGRANGLTRARVVTGLNGIPPIPLILFSVLSVQIGSAFATLLFANLGPMGTILISTTLSAVMLSIVSRPVISRDFAPNVKLLVTFGFVLACMELPFFLALQFIPLGVAATIAFLGPLGLALLASRTLPHFLSVAAALAGILLLTPAMGTEIDSTGLALAFLSSLAWAAFVPISKSVGQRLPGNRGLALGLSVSAIVMLPFAASEGALWNATAFDIGGTLIVALLTTVLPLACEYQAVQRISARVYGILTTLEPAAAMLVGFVFLGQNMSLMMLLAVACITVAALGIVLFDDRRSE